MPSSNNLLKSSTLRKFSGGLNVLDNDLTLKSHFATQLENFYTAPDGSLRLRYGTKEFTDLSGTIDRSVASILTESVPSVIAPDYTAQVRLLSGSSSTSLYVELNIPAVVAVNAFAYIEVSGFSGTLTAPVSGDTIDTNLFNGTRLVVNGSTGGGYTTLAFIVELPAAITLSGYIQHVGSYTINYPAIATTSPSTVSGNIINITYFQSKLICVTDAGEVISVAGDGTALIIWNEDIATEAGNSAGWTGTDFCSFAAFNDVLLICNGVDKPLRIDFKSILVCDYIKDPVSGNVNTPICRYVTVVGDFVVMAGDPEHVDRVYFSNKSTYTTWYGDTAPNDGTFYDTGKVINTFDQTITGIGRFRDKLLVFFTELSLIGTVGTYSGTTHVPSFDDTLQGHGCIAHNSAISMGYDFYMCDMVGVPSIKRAVATNSFTPERVSALIDPEIRTHLVQLSVQTQLDRIFALNNKRDSQYMLFVPNADSPTETLCYVFTNNAQLQISAWAVYRGWNFRCGCVSATNRVFFAKDQKVHVLGAYEDEFFTDSDEAISFAYESPWMSLESDQLTKLMKYIDFQTKGSATFTCDVLLDNKMYLADSSYDVQASMEFRGGDSGGFGVPDGPTVTYGEGPYGGGRRTNDSRSYAIGVRFKSIKLRVTGTSKKALRLVSITLNYLLGNMR